MTLPAVFGTIRPKRKSGSGNSCAELLGVKFRRQAVIGAYIVDFVSLSQKLIVELDGPQHLAAEARAYDVRRTEWLESRGFQVIRFRNQELDEDIYGVVARIKKAMAPPQPSPEAAGSGEGAGNRLI